MKLPLLSLLPALTLCAASAKAAEYWVGSGSGCQFPTIQQAVAAARATPEADTIRIAKDGPYTDQALLLDTSATLIGGYPTCGATDRVGYTSLSGNRREAVLVIASDATDDIEVHLDRLDISAGGWNSATAHWGGISIDGKARVHLVDSVVRGNQLSGIPAGTEVRFGGGITVRGPNAELVLERWIDIRGNVTSGNGGGILVDAGTLLIRPHSVTIKQNDALLSHGGGIAIVNGGTAVEGIDPAGPHLPVEPVRITHNRGEFGGGGVYVAGAGSALFAGELIVSDNLTLHEGGGIRVENQGSVQLSNTLDGSRRGCRPEQECLLLSDNSALYGGGGLAVMNEGMAHLQGVAVHGNRITGSFSSMWHGNAFFVHGGDSRLTLVGSTVTDNLCSPVPAMCAVINMVGGWLRFEYTTFARNGNEDGVLIRVDDYAGDASSIEGYASLVADKELLYQVRGAPPAVNLDCLLKNRGPVEGARSDVQPITFQDPDNGNYRLARGNAAIDYCDGTAPSSQSPDLNRQPRGIDDPNHPDRLGPYDLGAYEFGNVPDRLFADGFEAAR